MDIDIDPAIHNCAIGLGGSFPFRDESVQLVTANMVLECVPDPVAFLRDVNRILTPGGLFLFHTQNYRYCFIWIAARVPDALRRKAAFFLERRHEEDVLPPHDRTNSAGQIEERAASCGFAVTPLRAAGGRYNSKLIAALR